MEHLPSIRRSLQLLVLISLFVTAYFAKDLILPIVLGFLLALTLSPVGRALYRIGVPHPVSAFLLVTATSLVIAAVVLLSAGTVAIWSDEIPEMGREIQIKLSGVSNAVETMRSASEEVEKLGTETGGKPQEVVVRQPGLLDTAMDTVSKTGASLAVILILALFLLGSGELFYLKLVQSMPTLTEKKRALHTVYDVEKRVSRYLLTNDAWAAELKGAGKSSPKTVNSSRCTSPGLGEHVLIKLSQVQGYKGCKEPRCNICNKEQTIPAVSIIPKENI